MHERTFSSNNDVINNKFVVKYTSANTYTRLCISLEFYKESLWFVAHTDSELCNSYMTIPTLFIYMDNSGLYQFAVRNSQNILD